MKRLSVLLISLIFFTAGCSLFEKEKKEDTADTKQDNRTAYVVINGKTLYTDDFFKFAGVVLKEMNERDLKNEEVKKYLVKNFIEHNLLLQEARRRNIKVDEKKINAVTESFLSEAGTQDLKVYSGSFDTDAKALSEILREKFMVETLIADMINSNIDIKEDEIKQEYIELYSQKEPAKKAHLFQIFTTDKQVAEKAMAELKRGLAFNEVATRYSEGPEKEDGGDLGFIIDTDYPEIFGKAFKLKPGKISDIVKSEYGYHIFLVKEYSKPKIIDYDDVKTQIHFSLYNKEQDKKIEELINELYKNADIEYLTDINLSDASLSSKSGSYR